MQRAFLPGSDPPRSATSAAYWFAVRGIELLVVEDDEGPGVPLVADLGALGLAPSTRHFVGRMGEIECWAAELAEDAELPANASLHELRPLYTRLPEDLWGVAGRALQIVDWDRTHRFCGGCGHPTETAESERAKRCPSCGLLAFPRIAPAVIVRVTRGDEILLAHGVRFPARFHSVLAGFVEPGESLEEAAHRELFEEVGIEIANLRYFGSQPWPFPHSLMIGFTAEHAAGELRPDPEEIVEVGWYRAASMPPIPPRMSIARRLIDDFVDGVGAG